jgi:hypothetical protein
MQVLVKCVVMNSEEREPHLAVGTYVAFWALYVQLQASGWLPCKQLLWLLPP